MKTCLGRMGIWDRPLHRSTYANSKIFLELDPIFLLLPIVLSTLNLKRITASFRQVNVLHHLHLSVKIVPSSFLRQQEHPNGSQVEMTEVSVLKLLRFQILHQERLLEVLFRICLEVVKECRSSLADLDEGRLGCHATVCYPWTVIPIELWACINVIMECIRRFGSKRVSAVQRQCQC